MSFLKKIWKFLKIIRKDWFLPIIIALVLFGVVIILSKGSTIIPFIYTIF